MASAREMRERVQALRDKIIGIAGECIEQYLPEIVEMIQGQLLDGRDKNDELLTPSYSEDPYFKKPGAGERYAVWKRKLYPNSKRPEDTPNLIITGEFHRGIVAEVISDQIVYTNTASFGEQVIAKFGEDIFGLNEENRKALWLLIQDSFMEKVNSELVLD